MSAVSIARAEAADAPMLQTLRHALWPDEKAEDAAPDGIAMLARDAGGDIIGFAEATLRHDYVNGCETLPVAFLEGLFVAPAHRRQGIARALIEAVAGWARVQGVRELASDAAIDNRESHALHHATGFAETERVVFFRRTI